MAEENVLTSEKQESQAGSVPASSPGLRFLVVSLVLALVKLWLISSEEIVARYTPHDDLWYIHSAKEWYWLGSYSNPPYGTPPFIRPPVYPLFIALTKLTGIPLRISIELLLLIAAFVFVWSIIKTGQSWFIGILLFAAIIFHPASFGVYNTALPTTIYAPLLLFALAGMIMLLLQRDDTHRLRYALLTGTALAALWHVRAEGIVILALLAVYGLIVVSTMGVKSQPKLATLKQLGVMVLVPALIILIGSLAIKTINYSKFGLFAVDAVSGPGFESANKALLRIKPLPPIRRVAVPREVRQRAYRVSPAFRELESYLEGDPGRNWAMGAKAAGVQVEDEISSGHFLWAMNQAAYDAGHNKSARQADRYFQRIANEINAACDDGRLQCRWAFSSFLDPHVQNYLPYLPVSFRRIARLFFQRYEPGKQSDQGPPEARFFFDEMANRRATLNSPDAIKVLRGWAFNPNDSLLRIIIRNQAGDVLAFTDQFTPRPDVVLAYGKDIKVPENSGYQLEFPSEQGVSADIVFITKSGKEWIVPHTQKLHGVSGSPESLTYAVDLDETFTKSYGLQARVQSFIGSIYGRIATILTYLGLASLLVLVLCYRFIDRKDKAYAILALVVATVAIRVCLFALVDASMFRAAYDFYLFPVLYLYTCILLLLIAQAGSVLATRFNRHGILQRINFRKLHKKRAHAESS